MLQNSVGEIPINELASFGNRNSFLEILSLRGIVVTSKVYTNIVAKSNMYNI